VSRWVPGDLAVPPTGDIAHTVDRLDPDPVDGTHRPWTACGKMVRDGWTQSDGQHRPCPLCTNTDPTAVDVTDEIRILPRVDLDDMQTFVEVAAATATFLHHIADAVGDFAAAHDELHDHLQAIVDDERRKRTAAT
jgi:hypothetical protein